MHQLAFLEAPDVVSLEQTELLQCDRALTPRPRLADGDAAVVDRHGRFERCPPAGEVITREEATLLTREAVDLVGDEALVEDASRAVELVLA